MTRYFSANKKLWDSKVEFHIASDFYDMKNFRKGKDSLTDIVNEGLGDISGKKILHLQCHFGQDTFSLVRKGAKVTGVDFSTEAIKQARRFNDELGLDAKFIECNIYDLPDFLDEKFDMVFSSYGAIVWLPNLEKWAAVIERFLNPGGIFYLAEFHPFIDTLDWNSFKISYNYFNVKVYHEIEEGTYADRNAPIKNDEYFWIHPIQDVLRSLLSKNMELIDFREFDYSPYNCFPNMVEREEGKYIFKKIKQKIPYVFSVKVRKKN